jgi:uncharacterized membrane protein YphA (DoxX/SURF4 family)
MNLSFLCLIVALVLAVLSAWPWPAAAPGTRVWYGYFFPVSWALFLLSLVISHGGINTHG